MKFQYLSDVHLEIRKRAPDIKQIPGANNLILLGDIGRKDRPQYMNFIKKCSDIWKNIFVVYGNHEYYSDKFTINELKDKGDYPLNVHVLHNRSLYIDREDNVYHRYREGCLKIIGTTLWSDIAEGVYSFINDYNMIKTEDKNTKLDPKDTREMFFNNKIFILRELKEGVPSILLSHHGVSNLCNGKYQGSPLQSAFATNIKELKNYDNLIACFNGHTHQSMNILLPGTSIKLLANCYGYPGEKTDFDPDALFEF